MERNKAPDIAAEIAELYDAIYHLTKVVKELTTVILDNSKTLGRIYLQEKGLTNLQVA